MVKTKGAKGLHRQRAGEGWAQEAAHEAAALRPTKESQMQRGLLYGVAAMVAALAVFTPGASASGPAAAGKELIDLNCEGIGPVTVSVPRSENNNGAGQLVGEKGHGIPV